MNPIRIEPGALVAVPEHSRAEGTRWRLGHVYGLRPDVPGLGVLVTVDGAPALKRKPTRAEDGELFTAGDLRPVATEPEALAELHALVQRGRPCPFAGLAIRRAACEAGLTWTWNGWPGYAEAHGLDPMAPEGPDHNDRIPLAAVAHARGTFHVYADELRGFGRLFRRSFEAHMRGREAA